MKYKQLSISLIIVGALALSGCGAKEPVDQGPAPVAVEAVTAANGSVETNYIYSGKATPVQEATVFSTVNGIVNKVNFEIGDMVEEGAVLFEMDTQAINTNLKSLEASYEAGQANIASSQLALDNVNGAQTQMQIENARIAYENAKIGYENAKVMHEQGFVSNDDLKKAEDGYNQAKQSYELSSTTMIEENTKRAEAGLAAAQAQSKATAAQIEAARKTLADARVKSPISGVVTGKNVMEGVLLSNSSVPMTVSDLSSVIVKISVSEQVINSIAKGQIVEVKIATVSDEKMEGKIKTVNPAANQAGTYDVEVEIENSTGVVKSGMFAEVSFVREKGYNSIVLPNDAVISKNNETYVYVEENGVAVKKEVVTGINDGATVQVLKGIESDAKVIVKGQSYLSDGAAINLVSIDGKRTEAPQEKGE